jgi:N-acyl-L-homoserine lactone synthetase
MKKITFDLPTLHEHGSAYFDYLTLRKTFFVDQLHWPIAHNDKMEMDQYDNPQTFYSLVLDGDEVVGGARCMPTNVKWGKHTYMVADAFNGMLEDIPRSSMPYAYKSPYVWECSRLVISDSLTDRFDRTECLRLILEGVIDIANDHDANELIALSSVAMLRALRGLGYDVNRMGKPYRDNDDGRMYCVMNMPAVSTAHMIAAE